MRRGGDHREIADAFERHRERARDGRRRQRQHVDLRTKALQLLLLAHAEAVLLVDDDEAEVLELHVGLQELVRADHEIDPTVGEAFERRLDLLGRAEARQLGELDRPVGEAIGENLEVLFGQQRRRHEQHDLLAVGDRDERGAKRDLGLAEADVAADQPVHRAARGEVGDDRVDRRLLVGRLLEAEALGECFVVVLLERERVAVARRALRVQVEELGRGIVRLRGRLALRLLPLAAAELVQRRRIRRSRRCSD